jgi:hypothetical protein
MNRRLSKAMTKANLRAGRGLLCGIVAAWRLRHLGHVEGSAMVLGATFDTFDGGYVAPSMAEAGRRHGREGHAAAIWGSELAPGDVTLEELVARAWPLLADARSRGDIGETWRLSRALSFLEDMRDIRAERDGR